MVFIKKDVTQWLFTHRYWIALGVLIIYVLLNLNGSSIGMWANYIGQSELDNVLLGVNRAIRSDEWATFTPLAFSQTAQTIPFPYFNESVRATATDMFIVYGQPVWHFGLIFRPAYFGYLLFGLEKGLSFFWVFRSVWLFMSMFELGRVLTKDNRKLSVILAMLITFSPVVQWWFAVNGLVEMLAIVATVVVLCHAYLKTNCYKLRALIALGLAWAGGVYILTFYPAWQVPIGYIALALLIFVFWDNHGQYTWSWKKDMTLLLCALVIMFIAVGSILWQSKDTLFAVLNTDYPGKRVETGGNWGHVLFDSPLSIFYTTTGLTWERGMDVMYDCLPLTLSLSFVLWQRTKDKLLTILLVLNVFFGIYIIVGFPEIIAKLTLMSYSFGMRVVAPFGIVNVLLLVRALSLSWRLSKKQVMQSSVLLALGSILLACVMHYDYFITSHFSVKFMAVVITVSGVLVWGIYHAVLSKNSSRLLVFVLIGSIFFGMTVNPLRQGVAVIKENNLVKTMQQIKSEDDGIWMVDSLTYPFNNIPLLSGVCSVNVTNVYPNLNLWYQLDEQHQNKAVYNRYAHIQMQLDNTVQKPVFELLLPDTFSVSFDTTTLKTMNIRFILSKRDLSVYSNDTTQLTQKAQVNGFNIYQVDYK